jgi:hypothetical protein
MSLHPRLHPAAVGLVALLVVAGLGGCAQSRSPDAFCEVMAEHRDRYEVATSSAIAAVEGGDAAGLITGTAGMIAALGDLQLMWDELADVAPDEIVADVEKVRDHNQEQLDSVGDAISDPFGALAGSLASGLVNSGSYTRLNDYADEHCGSRPF